MTPEQVLSYYSFGGWKNSLLGSDNIHEVDGVRFCTIIKAMTSSKRLKGKVLKKINKKFLLERVINKVSQSNAFGEWIKKFIDKYFNIIIILFFILFFGGFFLLKYL